jgi:hypothetical protein
MLQAPFYEMNIFIECIALKEIFFEGFMLSINLNNVRKIRDRKQRKDIGKYSFVNRAIKNWNQLPVEALGTFPCKPKIFRNRVRKANKNGVK